MTYWVNVYDGGGIGLRHRTREDAKMFGIYDSKLAYRIKVTLKGKA